MKIAQIETGPLSVNTIIIPFKDNRAMVVDPGGSIELIIAQIQKMQLTPECILLTHGHFDHLIAVPSLIERYPSIDIFIHEADSHFLGSNAMDRHKAFFDCIGARDLVNRYRINLPEASSFVQDGDILNGWKILHTPGHSKGSICLYNEEESTLISGDTLFCGGIGRTDAPGGNIDELSKSLDLLSNLAKNTKVFPGHGPTTTIGKEFR